MLDSRLGTWLALVVLGSVLGARPGLCAEAPAVEYDALHPYELALGADWIVSGTIVDVDAAPPSDERTPAAERSAFTVELDAIVAMGPLAPEGARVGDRVRIAKFRDWVCGARWAPYAVGQRALWFLAVARDDDGRGAPVSGPWQVLGRGNEGELPLVDGRAFASPVGWKLASESGEPAGIELEAYGHRFWGLSLEREGLVGAVRALRALFRFPPREAEPANVDRVWPLVEQTADEALVERFSATSGIAQRLVEDLRRHQAEHRRLRAERAARGREQESDSDR